MLLQSLLLRLAAIRASSGSEDGGNDGVLSKYLSMVAHDLELEEYLMMRPHGGGTPITSSQKKQTRATDPLPRAKRYVLRLALGQPLTSIAFLIIVLKTPTVGFQVVAYIHLHIN